MQQNRKKTLAAAILALVMGVTFYTSNTPIVYATENATSEPIIEEESADIVEDSQSEDVKSKDAKPDDGSETKAETAPPETEENIADGTTAKKKTKKTNETTISEKKKKAEESKSEAPAETTVQTTTVTEVATTVATTTAVATTTQATFQTTTTPVVTTVQESESIEEPEASLDDIEKVETDETTTTLVEEPEPKVIQLGDDRIYVSMDEYQRLADRVADLEDDTFWHSVLGVGCVTAVVLAILSLAFSLTALSRNEFTTNFETQYENLHDTLALFYTTACAIRKMREGQSSTTEEDKQIDENLDTLISKLSKSLKRMNKDNK